MNSITEQRNRALAVLEKDKDEHGYSPIDYAIDDECRRVLNLPSRPAMANPYIGWMMPANDSKDEKMSISPEGVSHIKRWEGLRCDAYLCPAKVWTIGYGHTKGVRRGDNVTPAEAEQLLKEDLQQFEEGVRRMVKVPLNQGQYDALVSFAFNVGLSALSRSALLRYLNQGKYQEAGLQLHRWVYAKGKKLEGLVRRRNAEHDLFVSQ